MKYASDVHTGLDTIESLQDGCSITIKWFKAYPTDQSNKIAYHIYYSTEKETIFSEGVKFVSVSDDLQITLSTFTPGEMYYFCVRPVEYDPDIFDLENDLPTYINGIKFYPESVLSANISSTSLIIPLLNVDDFPSSGVIRIGAELINYLAVDTINNELVLSSVNQRGFNNSFARLHTTDGYDGYRYWDTSVKLIGLGESHLYDHIYMTESSSDYPNYPYTEADVYKQV